MIFYGALLIFTVLNLIICLFFYGATKKERENYDYYRSRYNTKRES